MRKGEIMKTSDSSLLAELKAAGFALTAEASRLRVAPADRLTDELRAGIREHRAELIALLAAESAPAVRSGTDTTPAASVRPERDMAPSRVSCGTCLHFLPDTINQSEGLGRCGMTGTGPPAGGSGYGACFPLAPRQCPSYQPRNER